MVLAHRPLTFRHWAGITPYTSPYGLSRELWFWYPVARAWTLRLPRAPPACGFTLAQHPFFRRYGVNLPSSLTRAHSSALVSSTSLPVSVCGTGTAGLPSRHFLAAQVPRHWPPLAGGLRITSRSAPAGLSLRRLPTGLHGARLAAATPPQHPASVKRPVGGTGICACCPSPVPYGYGLGPTNPPRCTRAAEPSGLRRWGLQPHFSVTHSGIRTRGQSTDACAPASPRPRRSPTVPHGTRSVGTPLCPGEASAQRYSTSELLRTLSRVAASKPTSWLSARHHNLSH